MAANQNTRPVGALPSDTEKNPQVYVVTLRNCRELEVPKKKKDKATPQSELVPKLVVESEQESINNEKAHIARSPPPFPQGLQKKMMTECLTSFLTC